GYSAGGRFCGQDCALDTDCPEGFACLDAVGTDGKRQCRAVSGDCPCTPRYVLMQLTTTCSLANEHGTCYGRRRCEAVGLTPCDASAAAPEICDGLDNDCDGQVNEGLAACVVCGDGKCGGAGEDVSTCPYDCHQCGDHICSPGDDLDDGVCKDDCCQCPDGICQRFGCGEDATTCPKDCSTPCGNKTCDDGENVYSCPEDCEWKACGNGTCEGGEDGKVTPGYCAADCGTACGNCVCDKDENGQSCPADCGWCGDLVCSRCLKEDAASCAPDCLAGGCGDGACDAATEDLVSCPKDCGQAADA
ncbi:MAG: hypothetical protein FJ087_22625, partial [Deltaproteobacteria bacterium]|nr:hypothetical protein [Deltaproteobacteria bacterium]